MHFWPVIVLRKQPPEASNCHVSPRLQHAVRTSTYQGIHKQNESVGPQTDY